MPLVQRLAQLVPVLRDHMPRIVRLIVLVPLAVLLASCSGGGGGGTTPPLVTYTVTGRVQKGPFAVGSSVAVNEQNASLSPTGHVYNIQTSDALGDFAVSSPIATPQVEIVAQGFYIDELTGQLSASQITLRALADLRVNASPTVNVLTTLQEARLKTLVSQGSTFAAAVAQSETEVLALFGIDSTKVNNLSTPTSMRIDGSTDSDAVLLAISVVLSQIAADAAGVNGTTQAAELSSLVDTLAAQLSSAGTVTSSTFGPAKSIAETEISVSGVTSNLQTYYAHNGLTIVAPKFQEWLDPSGSGVLPQRLVAVAGLAFRDVTGAGPGQPVTSNSVMVAGVGTGIVAPVSVSPGTTLVKNGAAIAGGNSTIRDGDIIALRLTAPGYSAAVQSTVSAGTSSAVWNVSSQPLGGMITGLAATGLILTDGGDNITVPPSSASFSFPTLLANGSSYNVTVRTQPSAPPFQFCRVNNGAGTVGSAPSNISVMCTTPVEQIVISDSRGEVAQYLVDPTTGNLDVPHPGLYDPALNGIVSDPTGKFVYITNYDYITTGQNISGYTISATTAALTPIVGSPFPAGHFLHSLIVDPSGKFAYAGSDAGALAYTIDPATGALTSIVGSPFPFASTDPLATVVGAGPFIAASRTFLYYPLLLGGGTFQVAGFKIDTSSGALTSLGPVSPPPTDLNAPTFGAVDPTGRFLLLAFGNVLRTYTIDVTTGALTLVVSTPGPMSAGAVVVHPNGKYAYVTDITGLVYAYSIDASTGALTAIAGSPFSLPGVAPTNGSGLLVFDVTGNFIYTSLGSTMIGGYAVDATTGGLSPVAGSPFRALYTLYAIVVTRIP
jgi:6-phosphogluconolactonase (cycloisomerase 2 family)